ncbi:Hypothetical protein, putative [Bodo saltans]|uniref:Cilia- and flagella-associated protein 300 n=1 Tax=Bodo saltans TaxID=75058 RepID=A0A0S4JGK6_BODSA|nr:Hypothetical protein, putative [Bodo saltans]|eukprot:CUG89312.1 Hypothetical protein, putative [Bodo saltans]
MIRIDEEPTSASSSAFTFNAQPSRLFETVKSDGEYRVLLEKWGLLPDTELLCFRFDQLYHRGMRDDFLKSLFRSDALRSTMRLANGRGELTESFPPAASVGSVTYEELTCTAVSLDMFDRLVDNQLVREAHGGGGNSESDEEDEKKPAKVERVVQMMDVYLPCGITVSDQLRGLFMLGEESEFHGQYYNDEEQKEFLYHVLWRLCAGGALNQWEDNFVTLKDAARSLYKDLVCVGRDEDTDELKVLSHVMLVTEVEGVPTLYPRDDQCSPSNGNYCYVVVNPSRKEVLVWYHAFWSTF